MEELLRKAFQLGQQWVHETTYNPEKEPINFNEWFNSDEVQRQVKLFRQPTVIKSVCVHYGCKEFQCENCGKNI